MDLTGLTFTPGLSRRFTQTLAGQSVLSPGQSQALQVLALRLPGFLGGATPAPDSLLRGNVGGLRPDLAVRAQTTGQLSAPQPAAFSPATLSAPVDAGVSGSQVTQLGSGSAPSAIAPSGPGNPFASQTTTDPGQQSDTATRPLSPVYRFSGPPPGSDTGSTTTPDLASILSGLGFNGGGAGLGGRFNRIV